VPDVATSQTLPATTGATTQGPRRSRVPLILGAVAVAAAAVLGVRGLHPPAPTHAPRAPTAADEPAFPATCAAEDERQLADARRPGSSAGEAQARLAAVVARCPTSAVARALLGTALVRLDRDAEAEAHLRAALELAPDYLAARYNLAVLQVKRGQPREALPLLDAVLAKSPEHATAHLVRGQARLAAGATAAAIDDLRAHTARRPEDGAGWALLAEALAKHADAAGARTAACRAVALGVDAARARCTP
jgi:predicted Zn-dependent protease